MAYSLEIANPSLPVIPSLPALAHRERRQAKRERCRKESPLGLRATCDAAGCIYKIRPAIFLAEHRRVFCFTVFWGIS